MIFKKLVLHNFGVYSGDNIFDFEGNGSVVLIGGMNGRGKTTILEAVLLALYGTNSFAYVESKYKTYGRYLHSYSNQSDGTFISFIQLVFTLDSNDDEYIITRSWDSSKGRISENIEVCHCGEKNAFLTDNWSMFIENQLPSGLSNFFFFDGEKIAELAEEETSDKMKDSIKMLLGVNVIDTLEGDIKRIEKRIKKSEDKDYSEAVSDALREKRDKAISNLQEIDKKIKAITDEIALIEKKIENSKIEYSAKGGDIFEKKQELFRERTELGVKIQSVKERLLDVSAGELPFAMVLPLLHYLKKQTDEERKDRENKLAAKKVKELYNLYDGKTSKELDAFISFIESSSGGEDKDLVYDLSDSTWMQLHSLCEDKVSDTIKTTNNLFNELNACIAKADELDSYLSVEIDESKVEKIYKKIINLEKDKVKLEVELKEIERDRPRYNGECITATSEFNKYVEGMLSKLEISDDNDRIMKYTHYTYNVLEKYKVRLQERKISVLAKTMTDCYKSLANKKGLIDSIIIDANNLDIICKDSDGKIVPKQRLSAGEKQLMVVALLWALAKCSRRKLPVIIDTPLSRLDSKHRMELIRTYFPHASDQTIVLSTDSEIYGKYYTELKKNIGREYTLDYNDDTKSTTILDGYRWEE